MKKILLSLILIAGLIVIYGAVNEPYQKLTFESPKAVIVQDALLLDDAKKLGINVSGLGLTEVAEVGKTTASVPVIGAYGNKVISVRLGVTEKERLQTLAHEYLHYLWDNMKDEEKNVVLREVRPYIQSDPKLLEGYPPDQTTQDDEGHAKVCTQVLPTNLSATLNAHCNSLITNRQLLFN